ncbi:Ricin [Drechslerella dactyloides]|uniref:Ricin n=1 Tax=Drechslerella dactyloides TaxID=74499 RepID=A0AAD6IV01_DREDA|nr:Ricin [Drechslerella dactyloides]
MSEGYSSTGGLADSAVPTGGWIPKGRTLFQVLSVKARLKNAGSDHIRVYGTIDIADATDDICHEIYNVDRTSDNAGQDMYIGDGADPSGGGDLIASPTQAVSADTHVSITACLSAHVVIASPGGSTNLVEKSIAEGSIHWDAFANSDINIYDEIESARILGPDGFADVEYIVMSDATEAAVRIFTVDTQNEHETYPYDIHGTVAANFSISGQPYSVQLFASKEDKDSRLCLKENGEIPLTRSTIAIPTDESLEITLNLVWNRNPSASSKDPEIIDGKATFLPDFKAPSSQNIAGKHGSFRVEATWT